MFEEFCRRLAEPDTKTIRVERCPHCGAGAILVESRKHKKFPYSVRCLNAFCGCKTERFDNIDGAVKAWNRRQEAVDT